MFAWCSCHLYVRNSHAPSASALESTDSISVRICSIDNTKKMGSTDCEVGRILKMHQIHSKARTSKCYWCFSEFCWRVFRMHTWLKSSWLWFVSVLVELTFHVNKVNLGMKCTAYKEEREDRVNVIWEGKCIETCQFCSTSLF